MYEKISRALSDQISRKYRNIADFVLFLAWSFLFLTFFRVFTFMGYARALRTSLLLGSVTYYFIPDFILGKTDDLIFVSFAFLVIIVRFTSKRWKRRHPIKDYLWQYLGHVQGEHPLLGRSWHNFFGTK